MKKNTSQNDRNKKAATSIIQALNKAGFEAYLVGGCVRDMLLHKNPSDFDVATSALPQDVESIFPQTIPVGKSFGVIIVQHKGTPIEVATFREDIDYTDGRRPNQVKFSSAIQDALRRDFTINGLYYDIKQKKVVDWVGGQTDLKAKIIRTIGDPAQRFKEDKLRMLRAIRFSANLNFPIQPETFDAIVKMKKTIKDVSMERIRDEFTKIFKGAHPDKGLALLGQSGLLEVLYPNTSALKRVRIKLSAQNTLGGLQLLTSLFKLLKNSSSIIFYALFIRYQMAEIPTKHAEQSAEDWIALLSQGCGRVSHIEKMCEALRLSNEEKKQIVRMIRSAELFYLGRGLSEAESKRLVRQIDIKNDLTLFSAEESLLCKTQRRTKYFKELMGKWKKIDLFPKQHLSGDDLMKLGLKPGPKVGQALFEIETMQLENKLRTKKQITDWVSKKFLT